MIAVGTESGLEMVGVEGGQDTERECPILCVRGGVGLQVVRESVGVSHG